MGRCQGKHRGEASCSTGYKTTLLGNVRCLAHVDGMGQGSTTLFLPHSRVGQLRRVDSLKSHSGQTTISAKMITEMRGADSLFFDLLNTVNSWFLIFSN